VTFVEQLEARLIMKPIAAKCLERTAGHAEFQEESREYDSVLGTWPELVNRSPPIGHPSIDSDLAGALEMKARAPPIRPSEVG
jgi:hypothetical protein